VFQETFVRKYLKNPFLWWTIFVTGITTFDSVFFANMIMRAIIIHQLYVPVLFGSLTFVFIVSFYPIQRGLVEFGRKESKTKAILFVILICSLFYAEVIYFMIEQFVIIATLSSETISDKNAFHIDIYVKNLIQFLALPLLSAFVFTSIKNTLKEKYTTNDKITNNLKFVAYVVIINIAMSLLFIFLTSPIWIDFSTWFSKNLGDVPSWIMAIATPFSIFIGFWIARKQLKQNAKIEEQKFFLELDHIFTKVENKKISRSIYDELYNSKNFEINGSDIESDVSNYLSDLEYVCNLYREGILSKIQLDDLYGLQITEAIKCKSVKNFIDKEREKTKVKDLYEKVEKVAKELEPKSLN
jgi:hypothetical protein